jgi:hypothetical protein
VIVSATVLSSKSVRVASVKWTSVTVAVHIGLGHEPGGAVGLTVVTVKRNWPFLGVSWSPVLHDQAGTQRRQLPAPTERRQIRAAAGVSLPELAGAIGTSHMAVDGWEKSAAPRSPAHLRAHSRLLDELRRLAGA